MRIDLSGLNRFQAKAVMIIAGVHGRESADDLATQYRKADAVKWCSEVWPGRWEKMLKAQFESDPSAFPCIEKVTDAGGVDFRRRDARGGTDRIASDDYDLLVRRARDALEAEDLANADEYELHEIVPIPAKCPRCKRVFLGRDAIRAPSLDNVACFYCGPNRTTRLVLHPDHKGFIDAKTARHGLFPPPAPKAAE